jgi:hypothetical protein
MCRYLKAPPFNNITWLSLSDNGGSLINGAAMAGQAAPAVCWLVKRAAGQQQQGGQQRWRGVAVPCALGWAALSQLTAPTCSRATHRRMGCPSAHRLPFLPAGGSSCIQGAKPGGGGMWTIAATVERIVRVTEQWEYWMNATG